MMSGKIFSASVMFLLLFSVLFVFDEITIPYVFAEQYGDSSGISHVSVLWISIIVNIVIGSILVIVFLFLYRLMNRKHIDVMSLIRSSLGDTKDILQEEKKMRDRLRQYARQAFNNDCGALLLSFGMLNKLSKSGDDGWIHDPDVDKLLGKSEKIFSKIRNTINLSVGVIDPVLLDDIEKFLIDATGIVDDVTEISAKYDEIKRTIMSLAERLSADVDDPM